ncbi:hypothetical protein OAC48_03160 [Porticoccaceae bacterium]|nr:hypothetical protein [Porticoccaceae bacterium]
MYTKFRLFWAVMLGVVLSGCASVAEEASDSDANAQSSVKSSYESKKPYDSNEGLPLEENRSKSPAPQSIDLAVGVENLQSLSLAKDSVGPSILPREYFQDGDSVTVAANEMPLKDFIHYIFGELLQVNYVLGPSFSGEAAFSELVSLRLSDGLSLRGVFDFMADFLSRRNIDVSYDNGVFFLRSTKGNDQNSSMVIGIGAHESAVPKTSRRILQVVPLKFGIKLSLERTLRSLVKAKITPDFEQSALFIEGRREEIIQALDLVKMLDIPAMRGKFIGLVKLKYLDPQGFSEKVSILLKNEGIDIGIQEPLQKNLVLVPLVQLSGVVVFATNEMLLQRVVYWSGVLDVPNQGLKKEYFVYSPKYARAVDLGKTLQELIMGASATDESSSGGRGTGSAPSSARSGATVSEALTMVIDKTANSLIFKTLGETYQELLPLMRSLDVMPRQVMLDITIAEVNLKDEFKFGVEWAAQRGDVSLTTQGAFGAKGIGGFGVSINGVEGPLDASFLASNALVNVLSNPSIMVKDGVSATISVGSDVSVVGSTTQDPISGERQTTTAVYRKTGVAVSVTPTINAQGIVSMTISQNISNSVPGSAGSGGNPDIFSRSLATEIVAKSGQTVLLGGLISENKSTGETGVPLFSKIPLLGGLFKSDSETSSRTELIMLITPQVIEDLSGWDKARDEFEDKLKILNVN